MVLWNGDGNQMSHNRRFIDTIKFHLARKSNAQLEMMTRDDASDRWSSEAMVAAHELLQDRLAGRATEPEIPEEDRPPEFHDVPTELVLGMFSVLVAGVLSGTLGPLSISSFLVEVEDPDPPVPFGYQMAWLCLDTTDTEAVAEALDLEDVEEATWGEGIEEAHRGLIYVTPPVADWTLVLGTPLFSTPEKMQTTIKSLLENLSRQFNEAHYFCNHRDVDLYGWARAEQGQLIRGYGWLGMHQTTLWNEGSPTEEESTLGFRCVSGQPPTIESEDPDEFIPLTEDWVLTLASVWSINPMTLDGEYKEPITGLLEWSTLVKGQPMGDT